MIVGAGPIAVPEALGFVPPRGDRRVLRARGCRLRPVAPRGSRLRRPARDGPRPAGRGDPRRRAPDLVEDGVTGLLVEPEALREAIERLLRDGDLRRRLGEAARERALEQHSWEAATAALVEVYSAANVDPDGPAAKQAVAGGESA